MYISECSVDTIFKCWKHTHIAGDLIKSRLQKVHRQLAYTVCNLANGQSQCHFRVQCASLTQRWWHASALGAYPPYQFNWTAAQHQDSYTHTYFLEPDGSFIVTNMGAIYWSPWTGNGRLHAAPEL